MKNNDDHFQTGKMKKEEEKRKKELARIEKEEAKKEMDAYKKEYTLEKSRVAMEKLQLGWIKWNLTCIALGLTAYKFYHSRVEEGADLTRYIVTGRELGIFLNILGFTTVLIATIQHKRNVEKLKLKYPEMQKSISLTLSYIVLVFSLIVFLIITFRR
jgi:uncharacterized membrane protein YidH (DUF202 family)